MEPQTGIDWSELESRADDLDVQAKIRAAIRKGWVRVAPLPGGGIRITPCRPTRPPPAPEGHPRGSDEL